MTITNSFNVYSAKFSTRKFESLPTEANTATAANIREPQLPNIEVEGHEQTTPFNPLDPFAESDALFNSLEKLIKSSTNLPDSVKNSYEEYVKARELNDKVNGGPDFLNSEVNEAQAKAYDNLIETLKVASQEGKLSTEMKNLLDKLLKLLDLPEEPLRF